MNMATQSVDLAKLFGTVATTLLENKDALNKADTHNHDHGDNMVEIFQAVTQAVQQKQAATPSEQLAYASQVVQSKSQSGSAKLYAEGLQSAATKLKGKKAVTTDNAVTLLQALMGTQTKVTPQTLQSQAQAAYGSGSGADLLGSLLGGMTGSGQSAQAADAGDLLGSLLGGMGGTGQQPASSGAGGDLLGSLLGGLAGTSAAPAEQDAGADLQGSLLGGLTGTTTGKKQTSKIDVAMLLKAGMAFMAAKQSGSTGMEALLQAIMAGSRVGNQGYRAQSGTLVASTLLQTLAAMQRK